jgi:tetratricopeptide (TPR) repeat protein
MKLALRENPFPIVLATLLLALVVGAVPLKAHLDAREGFTLRLEPGTHRDPLRHIEFGAPWELLPLFSGDQSDEAAEPGFRAETPREWRSAQDHYLALLQKQTTSPILNDLGVLHFLSGDSERALWYFDWALETPPPSRWSRWNRGVTLLSLGRPGEAAEDFRAALRLDGPSFAASYGLGVALAEAGDAREAIQLFQEGAARSSGNRKARVLYRLGEAYRTSGESVRASSAFEEALRLEPDFLAPEYGLAALEPHTPEGRRRASERYKQLLEHRPGYAPTYFHLGLLQAQQGDAEGALRSLQQAVLYLPEYRKARHALGRVLLSLGRWQDARDEFLWMLAGDPADGEAHFGLARADFGERRYREAAAKYLEALRLRGGAYPEAFLNLGLTYQRLGENQKAAESYRKAAELKGSYPEAHYNLGLLYLRQENWVEAKRAFEAALSENPDYAEAWFNLGILFTRAREEEAAIRAYREALRVRPDYAKARLNLAVRYAATGRQEEAIRQYRTLLEQHGRHSGAWYNLGVSYTQTGETAKAEEAFRRTLELDPGHLRAGPLLASALLSQGKRDEAVPFLREALRSAPLRSDLRLELARALAAEGRRAEALRLIDTGLRLEPENASLRNERQALQSSVKEK